MEVNQEKVKNIEIKRIKGLDNLADALAKHADGENTTKHLKGVGCRIGVGRHQEIYRLPVRRQLAKWRRWVKKSMRKEVN
jgi:hypothetical protein